MWTTVGHGAALAALDRAVQDGSPAHAYVFSGPEGVGKRTVALEFAAALNCTAPSDKPCGACRPCLDTLAGRHPDVELVEPGGLCDEPEHRDHADSRDLRICQVRRLERVLSLSPYGGGRRVAIIDAADTLRTEAANAFLKTLEEPPANTVIILLVERDERLPETVLSRCQKLAFHRLERSAIEGALLARDVDAVTAERIASAAAGRLGWALRAVDDASLLEERGRVLETVRRVAHAGRFERFAWARDAEGRGSDARERYLRELDLWEGWWRDVLTTASGGSEGLINRDYASDLVAEGTLYSAAEIVSFLKALLRTREYLQQNVDAQLALENLMLDLPVPTLAAAGFD
jgi:DNA polymerase-3 subunit delta'